MDKVDVVASACWVCIDKSSSTELSEAINSIFRWYRDAAWCFIYLSDISKADCGSEMTYENYLVGGRFINWAFPTISEKVLSRSRWFTRGWTLQELSAPANSKRVLFFTSDALLLGDRDQLSILIATVTGIPAQALSGGDFESYSVKERLQWAKSRSKKREQDKAYSLLGLFGVHMPLLYGKGRKNAMFRLLQERKAVERRKDPNPGSNFGNYVRGKYDQILRASTLIVLSPASIVRSSASVIPKQCKWLIMCRASFQFLSLALFFTYSFCPQASS